MSHMGRRGFFGSVAALLVAKPVEAAPRSMDDELDRVFSDEDIIDGRRQCIRVLDQFAELRTIER